MPRDKLTHEITNPVAQTLIDAAALIEERGLKKDGWFGDHGQLCLMAAIQIAAGLPGEESGRVDYIAVGNLPETRAFVSAVGWEGHPALLFDWNDAPGRTKEEVIAALHGAAEMVAGQ